MKLLVALIVSLAVTTPLSAAAQDHESCRRDELHVRLPALMEGTARAHVVINRSGRDPWAGPHGGTCVKQGSQTLHVADGARAVFDVPVSVAELLVLEVDREVLHISLHERSTITFVSTTDERFRLEGTNLDIVDHRGTRPGIPGELFVDPQAGQVHAHTPYGGACSLGDNDTLAQGALECHVQAQLGYCRHFTLRALGRAHTFWLNAGERVYVDVDRFSRVTARPTPQ